jgi:hypothetical protein
MPGLPQPQDVGDLLIQRRRAARAAEAAAGGGSAGATPRRGAPAPQQGSDTADGGWSEIQRQYQQRQR